MNEWGLILGMALLTFVPRYLPFGLAGRVHLPPVLLQALEYIPIAVLTAIITQTTLFRDGQLMLSVENAHLIAALVAILCSYLTRHLLLTVTLGLCSYALALWLL